MNVQQTNKQKEKGFTIIEVVLVLAIAGLIFLMVFIAYPALVRNQRDTQRRDDVSRFVSQLNSYATNNRGAIPSENKINDFLTSYMKSGDNQFKDPQTGEDYTVSTGNATTSNIQYQTNAHCNGEEIANGGGTRQAAIRIQLEGSGYFCQNAK